MKRVLPILASIAIAVAGCSGGVSGGSSSLPTSQPPVVSGGTGTALFTIRVPASGTANKRPNYVSAATNSASFQAGSGTPTVVALTLGSSSCPLSGGYYNCTAQGNLPAGTNESVTIKTFASTNGSGTPLSLNTVSETIVADQNNPITVTLNGVVNSFTMTYSTSLLQIGSSSSVTATFTPKDAAGDAIVGPGSLVDANGNALTPTLTDSDSSGHTTISGSYSSGYSIGYDGTAIASPTFTMTVGSLATQAQTLTATAIANGYFTSSGAASLTGWSTCSFPHSGLSAPVAAAPTPAVASPQPTATTSAIPTALFAAPSANPSASPGPTATPPPYIALATPPSNLADSSGPGASATTPPSLGSNVVMIGNGQSEIKGAAGICQSITVPTGATQLRFYIYEAGTQYNFKTADQEADVLNSAGTAVQKTLLAEINCLWDPNVTGGANAGGSSSGCIPVADGGAGTYLNEDNGGYWKQEGPFDLSAYAGTTVQLFIGIWDNYTDNYPTPADGNVIWVGGVTLTNT
jgi:hypothetical protein